MSSLLMPHDLRPAALSVLHRHLARDLLAGFAPALQLTQLGHLRGRLVARARWAQASMCPARAARTSG